MNSNKVQIGIAPINWSNDDLPELGGEIPFEQCISEMALAGFTGCEVGVKFPKDAEVLHGFLDIRGLQVCNQWFSFELTTKSLEDNIKNFIVHLDFLEAMGATVVCGGEVGNSCQGLIDVPIFGGKGLINSSQEWKEYGSKMNEFGKIANDRGFKFGYHHHVGTIVETIEEMDKFLENTDRKYIGINYDCGHFTFAGEDAVVALRRYIDCVVHVHVKDVRPKVLQQVKEKELSFLQAVKAGVFTVPGDSHGCVDFNGLFQTLKENEYEGWIVVEAEQDPAYANPYKYALTARSYIKDHIGI